MRLLRQKGQEMKWKNQDDLQARAQEMGANEVTAAGKERQKALSEAAHYAAAQCVAHVCPACKAIRQVPRRLKESHRGPFVHFVKDKGGVDMPVICAAEAIWESPYFSAQRIVAQLNKYAHYLKAEEDADTSGANDG